MVVMLTLFSAIVFIFSVSPTQTNAADNLEHDQMLQRKTGPDIFERRSINDQVRSGERTKYERFLSRYKGKKLWVAPGHLRIAYLDFYEKPDSLSPHLKEGTIVKWMLIKRAHYVNDFETWIEVALDNGATTFVDGRQMVDVLGELGVLERLSFVDYDPEEQARTIMANLPKYLPGRRVPCLGNKLARVCVGDPPKPSVLGSPKTVLDISEDNAILGYHVGKNDVCRVHVMNGIIKAIACE